MKQPSSIKSISGIPNRGIPYFLQTDEGGIIHGASDSLLQFIGKKKEELLGHPIQLLFSSNEVQKFHEFIDSDKNGIPNEVSRIHLDGRKPGEKVSFNVKRRKSGRRLIDWSSIISEVPEMLSPTADDNPWFINFFERSSEPVFIYNAVDLSITFVNASAAQLFGYEGKDLLNCFLYEEEGTLQAATPENPYLLKAGSYSLLSRSGKQVSVQVFTSPLDINGFTHCLVFGMHASVVENELQDTMGVVPHTPGEWDMIVSSMDDVVFEYDCEGLFRKIWCRNETVLLMIPEKFIGKSMQEAFRALPDFVGPFIQDFELAIERNEICLREFPIHTATTTRWFTSKISPLYHPDGKAKGFTQRITDITEQKLVSLAIDEKNTDLKAAHRELGEIIEHASEIIFKIDLEGKFIFVSPEATRSLGFPITSLKGKPYSSLIHPEDLPQCEKVLRSLSVFGNKEKSVVCRVRLMDGKYQWFSISAHYIFNDKKQPLYCIGFAKDVSDLHIMVENLQATEERYAAFINHSSEAIWRFEPGELMPVTTPAEEMIAVFMKKAYLAECNEQMARFYGFTAANDIIGTPLHVLMPESDPRNIEFLTAFINNGFKLLDAESFELDRNGNKKYFLNNLIGIIEDGILLRVWGTQRDITDQRIAEEQIRFLARVVKDVSDVIISTDLNFHVLAWNKAAEHVYGISEKEALGKPIRLLVEHQYLNHTREEVVSFLNNHDTWQGEAFFDRRDGKRIYVSLNMSYVKNEKGERIGFAGIHRDITEKRESDEAVRNSELRYRSLVEALGEGIFMIDKSMKIIACNRSAEIIFGRGKDQLIGTIATGTNLYKEDGTVFSMEEQPSTITLSTGTAVKNVVMGVERSNHSVKWISINTEPIYYNKDRNKPDAIVASVVDITEQKKAQNELMVREKQLREYSERISSILDSITDGFIAVDNELKVLLWNHVFEKATGKTSEEVTGKKFTEIFPDVVHNKFYELSLQALHDRKPFQFEAYSQSFDLWFESSAYPSSQGLFIYFRDITERKTQENILALEKDVLEINTQPLASLKNTVDYFLEGLEKIFPGMLCSVLALDEEAKKIRHLSAPSLPITFARDVDGLDIGPNAGSCGTAMYSKRVVICSDIENDPLWVNMKSVFLPVGIRASWAFPITDTQGNVIATISSYYKTPKSPDEKALQVLHRVSKLLGIIIVNKQSEERVRVSNERYLLISKASNGAIWDWEIQTDRLYWGEGFNTLFGYHQGYIENSINFWKEKIHPDDREQVWKSISGFFNEGSKTTWSAEYRFCKADGSFVLVHDQGFLIYNQEGKIHRMVGSMQDITEKKEMENQLLKQQLNKQQLVAQAVVDAQEKERADIGKELHDNVNQILSTARLYLDLARSDEGERLNLIKRSTENIYNAINEIRNISRSLVPGSIGDLGIIASISDLVESIMATKKLHVEFYHVGEVDALLDEKQKLMLFRIIQEQVNNVLKHANARNLVIELVVDDDAIELIISDNGIGFDPDSVKNKKGVGLYNITSRAELFNGKVNIVTAPGNGCKLNINVPLLNL
ncbi:MAG TPA: PAS domain S-box protein [Flavitalea sp.]|nr:PAS domain S-box protein [Flavitalea sp.]